MLLNSDYSTSPNATNWLLRVVWEPSLNLNVSKAVALKRRVQLYVDVFVFRLQELLDSLKFIRVIVNWQA
ncbi:hypothetical protein Hmuk_2960 [Halomicrobium mukohataei DSM 12286]|uniref:Uncharacterized protein n=1 Tax=Halomicrobium mukohataei (strain ATCC 700874 / DSM 12286 / JCM 9738 / NCIMB 13541) TaxID=485914 RepID=C7P150_HALMD|nr:hypothetical protein Hmuk_2960 [Halomicrobium mukohataei DSM 12286]